MTYLSKGLKELMELILELEAVIEKETASSVKIAPELLEKLAICKNFKAFLEPLYENLGIQKDPPFYTKKVVKEKLSALIGKTEDKATKIELKNTYKLFRKALKSKDIEWESKACDQLFLKYFPIFKPPLEVIKMTVLPIQSIPVPDIEPLEVDIIPIPKPILIDDEIRFGNNLLRDFPNGLTAIFYEIDDSENLKVFKDGSNRWAKEQKAIGFSGKEATVSSVKVGLAMPEYIQKKSAGVGASITSLGAFVKKCMLKAHKYNNQLHYRLETKNPVFMMSDDAYLFKTIALSSHGWTGGISINGTSDGKELDVGNIEAFIKKCSPYLTSDVNVIFYSCTTAIGENDSNNLDYLTSDGGSDSLIAKAIGELGRLGHNEAEAWGHTTVGGYLHNRDLRYFKVSDSYDGIYEGKNYMRYCYGDFIESDIKVILDLIKTNYNKIYNRVEEKQLRILIDKEIISDFLKCYNSAFSNRGISITHKTTGKKLRRKLSEIAPIAPKEVKDIILKYRSTWKKTYTYSNIVKEVITK